MSSTTATAPGGLSPADAAFLQKSMAHPCPVLQVEPTEAMLSLEKRGYIRFDGVRVGPLGVVTGEKWVAVTEAGRIAITLAGVPDPERAVGAAREHLQWIRDWYEAKQQGNGPLNSWEEFAADMARRAASALALLGATP